MSGINFFLKVYLIWQPLQLSLSLSPLVPIQICLCFQPICIFESKMFALYIAFICHIFRYQIYHIFLFILPICFLIGLFNPFTCNILTDKLRFTYSSLHFVFYMSNVFLLLDFSITVFFCTKLVLLSVLFCCDAITIVFRDIYLGIGLGIAISILTSNNLVQINTNNFISIQNFYSYIFPFFFLLLCTVIVTQITSMNIVCLSTQISNYHFKQYPFKSEKEKKSYSKKLE